MKMKMPKAHPISWMLLLITTLAILMTSISRIILPTLLPAIMEEYNWNATEAGFLNSAMFIGAFLGATFFGILSDIIGSGYKRGWTWVMTMIVAAIGGIFTAMCTTVNAMRAALAVLGCGTGGSEPVNVAIIGEWWPKEHRGFAIGVHHTGFPIGQFVGPVLISMILAVGTWHNAFTFIPLLAIPIIILQLIVGTDKNQKKVYAWIDAHKMTKPLDETSSNLPKPSFKEAVKNVGVCIKNRNCVLAIITTFVFLWCEAAITTFMTLQLTTVAGVSLTAAAIVSGASGLTGWIGQIGWGTLSDTIGRKVAVKIINAGFAIATIACIFINSEMSGWIILIFWGLFRNSPYPVIYALLLDSL
jgi:MFS family permease